MAQDEISFTLKFRICAKNKSLRIGLEVYRIDLQQDEELASYVLNNRRGVLRGVTCLISHIISKQA